MSLWSPYNSWKSELERIRKEDADRKSAYIHFLENGN